MYDTSMYNLHYRGERQPFVFVDAVYEYKKNTWFHAKEKGISTSLS